jgi:hypothetical protein
MPTADVNRILSKQVELYSRDCHSAGELEDVQPLLDCHVSIPAGSQPIAEQASLMGQSAQPRNGISY